MEPWYCPPLCLCIFDANHASTERIYKQFWTQTPVEMAMFSSLPMETPPKQETYYDFFPARCVTQYLSKYVNEQIYCDRSIRQRLFFNRRVIHVEFSEATRHWQITCDGVHQPLFTTNLLVAAGLTSQPNMPELGGQDAFQGSILHHVDFGSSLVLKDIRVKHIAVLGGAKSAADVAYAAAKAGKTVSWIIRKSGNGPAHFTPARGFGPYKNSNELLYTRLTAVFNPSMWNRHNWLSRLFHETRFGRRIIDWIWEGFDANSRHEAGFDKKCSSLGSESGFANLEPDTS